MEEMYVLQKWPRKCLQVDRFRTFVIVMADVNAKILQIIHSVWGKHNLFVP